MTKKQAYIAVGVAAAVLAFGYLATRREVNATVTAGDATITYLSIGDSGATAPTGPTEDSHERMLRLIELSSAAIKKHDEAIAAGSVME